MPPFYSFFDLLLCCKSANCQSPRERERDMAKRYRGTNPIDQYAMFTNPLLKRHMQIIGSILYLFCL